MASSHSRKYSERTIDTPAGDKGEIGTIRLVLVLALLALSVLSALALLTYNSQDPSLNSSMSGAEVHNWVGLAGSYSADFILQIFGYIAIFFPPLLFCVAFFTLRRVPPKKFIGPIVGLALVFFAIGALITLSWQNWEMQPFPPGGLLAQLCVNMLRPYTGGPGTVIIMAVLLAMGLVIGFGPLAEKFGVAAIAFAVTLGRKIALWANG